MSDDILQEIACPNCRNPIDIRTQHGSHVQCDACSSRFILRGHICPNCNTYHEEERAFCRQCGDPLSRICPKCQTKNWVGDEYCQQCGSAMDLLELMKLQHEAQSLESQHRRSAQIQELKQHEELAAQKRLAELEAIETERQRWEQEQKGKQRQQEMLMFAGLGIVAVVVALSLLLITLL